MNMYLCLWQSILSMHVLYLVCVTLYNTLFLFSVLCISGICTYYVYGNMRFHCVGMCICMVCTCPYVCVRMLCSVRMYLFVVYCNSGKNGLSDRINYIIYCFIHRSYSVTVMQLTRINYQGGYNR